MYICIYILGYLIRNVVSRLIYAVHVDSQQVWQYSVDLGDGTKTVFTGEQPATSCWPPTNIYFYVSNGKLTLSKCECHIIF